MASEQSGGDTGHIDAESFGREWERMEEILHVDWEEVFPDSLSEMSPDGFYVRLALGNQITGGTSVRARETRYNPALEHAVRAGRLEIGRDDDGEPVVRLPGRSVDTDSEHPGGATDGE